MINRITTPGANITSSIHSLWLEHEKVICIDQVVFILNLLNTIRKNMNKNKRNKEQNSKKLHFKMIMILIFMILFVS